MNCFLFLASFLFLTNPLIANVNNSDLYLDLLEKFILYNPAKETKYTLISKERLDCLWECMEEVEKNQIPGDFIETGVWQGGATIFMRGFLQAHNNKERKVWVADSFAGFPLSNRLDEIGIDNQNMPDIVVSVQKVKNNFKAFNLLDDQVVFLKGFFSQTLPNAPIEKIAILRLDGDLYESTWDGLVHLYPKLSVGGYIIIDDYGHFPGCARAVEDYRNAHNINDEIQWEDYTGVHWKKTHE